MYYITLRRNQFMLELQEYSGIGFNRMCNRMILGNTQQKEHYAKEQHISPTQKNQYDKLEG